jgi:uncharacterized protein YjiS (DUF1127 family)
MDTGLLQAGLAKKGLLELQQGEVLRLRDAGGRHLGVVRGNVWVTQHGDPRDHVLRAGESFAFDRDGVALVLPLDGAARVVLEQGIVAEHPVIATTRDAWQAYTPEFERAARQLRAQAIANLTAALGRRLKAAWGVLAGAAARAMETRRTAQALRALSDHTLKDLGLRRDQIDCVARQVPC